MVLVNEEFCLSSLEAGVQCVCVCVRVRVCVRVCVCVESGRDTDGCLGWCAQQRNGSYEL